MAINKGVFMHEEHVDLVGSRRFFLFCFVFFFFLCVCGFFLIKPLSRGGLYRQMRCKHLTPFDTIKDKPSSFFYCVERERKKSNGRSI